MNEPFIVAEMSANHLGSIDRALDIVKAAADAGADAIKLQTWTPDTMCIDPGIVLGNGPWHGRSMMELYREAHTPWSWHAPIFAYAKSLGLIPFSAAFDVASVDFLESLGVTMHKVASFELVDLPLIRHMASKGKPMILSTGMASAQEIQDAGECAVIAGCNDLTVLNCSSAYPADPADADLRNLGWKLDGYVAGKLITLSYGLSDHTMGCGVACAAAALGATMIEKHLTLSRADGGPDAGFSMEPHEFKQMVEEVRRAAAAVQPRPPGPKKGEDRSLRRSFWVTRDVLPGEPLVLGDNVATARPALGLPPSADVHGKVANRYIPANTPLTADMLA